MFYDLKISASIGMFVLVVIMWGLKSDL